MSILQTRSATRGVPKLDVLLVVSTTLLLTAAPLVPRNAGIGAASGITALAVLAWYRRCRAAAPFSTFCVICLGLALSRVLYFQVVLGVALLCYAGIVRGVPWLLGTATWARCGSFDATVRFLAVAVWLLSAAALLSWYLLLHPNIADIVKAFVPALPLGLLIAGGLIFSMVNAAVEEGAYRGVMLHALDMSLGPGFAALLLQALAFGAIHIRGFPGGWIGVGLACIYGLLMGVIRRRAGGMFAPWIAHVFTDIVIAGMLLFLAQPNQAPQPAAQTASFIWKSSVTTALGRAATCVPLSRD